MNYIVLNGIRSTTIPGLMIQTLPPISKPLLRTQIDVIDGRDGDIVTPLGFSAYDKAITIGLYGDFDIDRVIQYFSASGTVIFSNEPDKYYNYAIYAQIDYDQLIRYRTATVTFHVQPFKYAAADATVSLINDFFRLTDAIKTNNGITASISNGVLSILGSAETTAEILLRIPPVYLSIGEYVFRAYANGQNAGICKIGLCNVSPSDPFGAGEVTLQDGSVVSISGTLASAYDYDTLYICVEPGEINISVSVQIAPANNNNGLRIVNNGNYISKPKLTVHGCGDIGVLLNGTQTLLIRLAADRYVTIDAAAMDAYKDGVLKNRSVTGDYGKLQLPPGANVITFDGMVQQLDITDYSRWI